MKTSPLVVLFFAFFGNSFAFPCRDFNDKLLGHTCFEFVEIALSNYSVDMPVYDIGTLYCRNRQKQLAIVQSTGEQYFLANTLKQLEWSDSMVGLRYKQTPWMWTSDGTFVKGQGCVRTSMRSDLISTLPSTYSAQMTTDRCIDFCAQESQAFAAIQDGAYCYCSNQYVWDETASNCSMPCAGAYEEWCGSAVNSALQFTAEDVYDNWLVGRPTTGGSCAAVKVDKRLNHWVDTSCSLELPFFCKYINIQAKPYGNARSACGQGACYYYFSQPQLSWQAADKFCIENGGRLATIESEDRQRLISTILSDDRITASLVWIGAARKDWYFPDGSSLKDRLGWASPNEPVNQESNSCADLIVGSLNIDDIVYGWRARSCSRLRESNEQSARFICSSPAVDSHSNNVVSNNELDDTTPVGRKTTPAVFVEEVEPEQPDAKSELEREGYDKPDFVGTNPAGSEIMAEMKSSAEETAVEDENKSGELSPGSDEVPVEEPSTSTSSSTSTSTSSTSTTTTTTSTSTSTTTSTTQHPTEAKKTTAPSAIPRSSRRIVPGLDSSDESESTVSFGNVRNEEDITTTSPGDLIVGEVAALQAINGGNSGINDQNNNDLTKTEESNKLTWWGILLIVLAALILLGFVILVIIFLVKRSGRSGKLSGRISPMSTGPLYPTSKASAGHRANYTNASSRQSSARTMHGRNNQVLLY